MKILGLKVRKFKNKPSTINVVETWCVKWLSLHPRSYGEHYETNIEIMTFVTKQDAEAFAKELNDASRLLKNGKQGIEVYRQEYPDNL